MARSNVIFGLVEQLRLTSGFEQGNKGTAVAYDHRVLVQGVDRAAIVLADTFANQRLVIGGLTEITYSLSVHLFVRHNNDVVAARGDADLYASNIIQRINNNPTLGGSAYTALLTEGRVEDEDLKIGGVHFLWESLTVTAKEHLVSA